MKTRRKRRSAPCGGARSESVHPRMHAIRCAALISAGVVMASPSQATEMALGRPVAGTSVLTGIGEYRRMGGFGAWSWVGLVAGTVQQLCGRHRPDCRSAERLSRP